jgi:hypothetical protein
MTNEEALAGFSTGITDPALVAIAVDRIPCAIETVEEAIHDGTSVQINGPRALMIVQYKGMLVGLAVAEDTRGCCPSERKTVEAYAKVAVDRIIRAFTGGMHTEWWDQTDALRKQRREEWLRMIKLQMRNCIEEDAE